MQHHITGWLEIVNATSKSATSIQDLFHDTWLAHYPQPQFNSIDNETEGKFKREFKQIFIQDNYDTMTKSTTSNNHCYTNKHNH
jgi:hypothetical protein